MKQTKINISLQIKKLVEEKELSSIQVYNIIEDAFNTTYLKDKKVKRDLIIKGNEKEGIMSFFEELDVVNIKSEEFPDSEILLEDAKKNKEDIQVGETIVLPFDYSSFSYFGIAQIKQRIKHSLNILQSKKNYEIYKEKKGKILSGTVENVDFKRILVDVSGDRAFIPTIESIPYQNLKNGQIIKFYVKEVILNSQYGQIKGSRVDTRFLEELFKLEVPEVNIGLIKIIKIVHVPGIRAKVAIQSFDDSIDPIGSCVGKAGTRISAISGELKNERIDVFLWDENEKNFLLNACTPIKVVNLEILDEENKKARIIVIKEQYDLISRRNNSWKQLLEEISGFEIQIETLEEFGKEIDKIVLNGNLTYDDLENLEIEKEILNKCKEVD